MALTPTDLRYALLHPDDENWICRLVIREPTLPYSFSNMPQPTFTTYEPSRIINPRVTEFPQASEIRLSGTARYIVSQDGSGSTVWGMVISCVTDAENIIYVLRFTKDDEVILVSGSIEYAFTIGVIAAVNI